MVVLWPLVPVGVIGGTLLFLVATLRLIFFRRLPFLVSAETLERRLFSAAFVAAFLGSDSFFLLPAFPGVSCSMSASSTGVSSSTCTSHSQTFFQSGGLSFAPLLVFPTLIAGVPLVFLRYKFRALIAAVCAFLLAAIGVTGFGPSFALSSVILVIAGFIGVSGSGAQPSVQADGPTSDGPAA